MEKKFKYDAFISYRHADLDKFVAENLHRELEAFRLPKSIAKKRPGQKNRIERVFRDREELPLTSDINDPIMSALRDSEYLIVICSPRLRESMWCKKEIETFVELRGREHVMGVLIEGEPLQSFPDELLFRTEKRVRPDGIEEEIRIPVEPLAADVRGKTKKEVKKLIPSEVQRLCAGMFHLNYDDIRQRHREQKMKRILTASLIGGAICLAFGIYSTATALRIHSQNKKIEAQSVEIQAQADEILQQNEELSLKQALSLAELAEQYLENGDRQGAIETAKEALTKSDDIILPYTPEAQYILNESVRAYDIGISLKAEYQIETAGRIEDVKQTNDGSVLAIFDSTQTITLFDMENREIVGVVSPKLYNLSGSYGFTFVGNDRFAYISTEKEVCIIDLVTGKTVKEIPMQQASSLVTDVAGNYIAVEQWNNTFVVIDGSTYEELGTTPDFDAGFYVDGPYISENGIMACSYSEKTDDVKARDKFNLYFVDLNTMETISTLDLGYKRVKDLEFRDNIAYAAIGEYEEMYSGADAYAVAIDIANGQILWENVQEGYWVDELALPFDTTATDLLLATSENISMINMQDGSTVFKCTTVADVLDINSYETGNDYLVFFDNGEMAYVNKDSELVMDLSYRFECKTVSNSFIENSNCGTVVVERNDNMVTIYTKKQGPEVKAIPEQVSLTEDYEVIIATEAKEIAQSYDLENYDYVLELYYSPDQKYCFITYWDHSFIIYDTEAKEIVQTMESAYDTELCLGTDEDGYTYLAGFYGVYVLNEDMKPVMWIEHAVDVDLEKKRVYMNWLNSNYEAPLYSVDDLLKLAESYGK